MSESLRESFRKDGWNLPNCLTYLRIVLAVIPAILMVVGAHDAQMRWWALGIFLIAVASDGVDGFVARYWNMTSEWGAFIDPLADKLLVLSLSVGLTVAYWGESFGWVLILVAALMVARELTLAVQIKRHRDDVPPPTMLGKVKTAIQFAMLAAWIMPSLGFAIDVLRAFATNAAIVVTLLSWIQYHQLYVRGRTVM